MCVCIYIYKQFDYRSGKNIVLKLFTRDGQAKSVRQVVFTEFSLGVLV
jgi:hypothetical protein